MFSKDVLIGIGCSHTQGCAFVKKITNNRKNPQYDLASLELKEKYNREQVDQEFLTNVSWLGQLNKQLGFKKVLNFGGGGFGIQQNIDSIKSYVLDKESLDNHLFIWQVPSFDRITLSFKKEESYTLETFSNLINPDSDFKDYHSLDLLFDELYQKMNLIEEIYVMQRLIESMGGIIYFIFSPLNSIDFLTEKNIKMYRNLYKVFDRVRIFKEYHSKKNPMDYYKKLHKLELKDFSSVNHSGIGPKRWTLDGEGLLEGDMHYSEHGNFLLAQSIYNELVLKDERLS